MQLTIQKTISMEHVVWCTFIDPEFAPLGIPEDEASEKGDSIHVYTAEYSDLDRAVVDEKTTGKTKVICDRDGFVLGSSIPGERTCKILGDLQLHRKSKNTAVTKIT